MTTLRDVLERQPLKHLRYGSAGTLTDYDGRIICTFNLKDVSLQEAFTYAELFKAAVEVADVVVDSIEPKS